MNVESLPPVAPFDAPFDLPPLGGAGRTRDAATDFAAWLQKGLAEANQQLVDADQQLAGLALGETDNLHQVMIALEQAKLSFQLMVQVRNKLLESYQDILRMQI